MQRQRPNDPQKRDHPQQTRKRQNPARKIQIQKVPQ